MSSLTIGAADMEELARGAAILGSGGGGDPYIGALLARQALQQHGPVSIVGLPELDDDDVVVAVAMMGAPTVMIEKLPGLAEIVAPIEALAAGSEHPVTHVVSAEAGGINSTIPVAAAAALGVPLVDADGMGRAFPELQMVLPTLYGITASPLAIADEKGNTVVLRTIDNVWTERIARVVAIEMGTSVMISGFRMTGRQAKECLVGGSLTLCRELGRTIRVAREEKRDPVAAAAERLGARQIHEGKIIDVERKTASGFARGRAQIAGAYSTMEIAFQNEYLVASSGGVVLATTPDLIIVFEHETGEPITTEGLRYGQRVRVLAAPADPRWHTEGGLALVGPRYFGYDIDPVRVRLPAEEA